jgi:hypothetical protein
MSRRVCRTEAARPKESCRRILKCGRGFLARLQPFSTTRITPHVAQNTSNRRSAVDERTTRHGGYEVSQRKRKRVEQSFGWMKMVGMLKKVKLRGIDKIGWLFTFTGAAYNLCRLQNLMART